MSYSHSSESSMAYTELRVGHILKLDAGFYTKEVDTSLGTDVYLETWYDSILPKFLFKGSYNYTRHFINCVNKFDNMFVMDIYDNGILCKLRGNYYFLYNDVIIYFNAS